jgi:hypothetical protein
MRKRAKHERGRRQRRRLSIRARIVQFVRALFSSRPSHGDWDDGSEGGLGVREPRWPFHPSLSGAVALEAPPEETRDVWAVGDESG